MNVFHLVFAGIVSNVPGCLLYLGIGVISRPRFLPAPRFCAFSGIAVVECLTLSIQRYLSSYLTGESARGMEREREVAVMLFI